jgi:hypothetical protein
LPALRRVNGEITVVSTTGATLGAVADRRGVDDVLGQSGDPTASMIGR